MHIANLSIQWNSQAIPLSALTRKTARPFDGHLFGTAADYLDDDFGQGTYVNLDSNDEESNGLASEHEERLYNLELENSWEPKRQVPHTLQVDDDVDSDMPVDGHPANSEQRLITEERADSQPQVVRYSDVFPSSRDGCPMPLSASSADSMYTTSVHGQDNLWAPFT